VWRDYFAKNRPGSRALAELILDLHAQKQYKHVIAAIEAALLAGQAKPWMYDVLALAMQLDGRPQADVERVLLSRVDFAATDVPSMLLSAAYLTRFGAKPQALKLYRQAAQTDPARPEAYVLAMRLARDMSRHDDVLWAAPGVLRTAWMPNHDALHREAEDAALKSERALTAAGKTAEAGALRDAMSEARVRDLVVRLEWTGEGDLDLSVDEPPGTVCSEQDPQTRGGGIHMHDGYGPDPKNCYEQYTCPLGMPGVYVVHVRRVDGRIVGNRAQLTVTQHQGARNESKQSYVLKLDRGQAAVRISLADGRRKEAAPVRRQADRRTSFLERLLFPADNGRVVPISAVAPAAPGAAAAAGGLGQPGAIAQAGGFSVGYQPVVQLISEGASLNAAAAVSGDLRYVRLAVNPTFSSITDVFQFTFASGGR
jgi:hypothetical protein